MFLCIEEKIFSFPDSGTSILIGVVRHDMERIPAVLLLDLQLPVGVEEVRHQARPDPHGGKALHMRGVREGVQRPLQPRSALSHPAPQAELRVVTQRREFSSMLFVFLWVSSFRANLQSVVMVETFQC